MGSDAYLPISYKFLALQIDVMIKNILKLLIEMLLLHECQS